MANLVRNWERVMGLGCVHGHLANPESQAKALDFKRRWRPKYTFELGDVFDTTAFRSGARGGPDESEPIAPDYKAGIEWLRKIEPTHFCFGNHEDRLFKLAHHPNAIVSHCASIVLNGIYDTLREMHCDSREYDIRRGWFELGGVRWGHGYMFNEMALRDHAEVFGSCVIAHLHKPGEATGRRVDGARALCVGTLSSIPAMAYAKTFKSRLAWGPGLVWGEVCEDEARLWLSAGTEDGWYLPNV